MIFGAMQMWTCKKCSRKFKKKGQPHSCNIYSLGKHFERKETAKALFSDLRVKMKKTVGPFKVESLPCCIHFVTTFTFAAAFAMKDKLRLTFTVNHPLKSTRLKRPMQIAAKRFYYHVDIMKKGEIDRELLSWLKQASRSKR